jgi:hypothetical protein
MFGDGTSPDQVYTCLAAHTRKEMRTETPGVFLVAGLFLSQMYVRFSDARKIFLTDENGFLTYHGFMTITTSSRIISRDRLDLTRRRGSCFKFHPVVKQCMICNLRMFTVNNVVHSTYAIPESTLI